MSATINSTADLAAILGQPLKRLDNDIQQGYLPLDKAVGRGRSRSYDTHDANRCALFYALRDTVGVKASVARDLLPRLLWTIDGDADTLCAVYRHNDTWHAEVTTQRTLFDPEVGAFAVSPAANGEGGMMIAVEAVALLNASAIIRRISQRMGELAA